MSRGNPGVPRKSYSEYRATIEAKGLTLVSEYGGRFAPAEFRCAAGHVWTSNIDNALGSKHGCRVCADFDNAYDRLRDHDEYCAAIALTGFVPLESYAGANEPIRHECQSCGYWLVSTPRHIEGGLACPSCGRSKYKLYQLGSREVKLRGFEPQALDWILDNTGIRPDEIVVDAEGTPTIIYVGADRITHRHRPDFWVPNRHLLVEVKSLTTLGLDGNPYGVNPRSLWIMQCRKAKAALRLGYDYRLLVMDAAGQRVKMPDDWMRRRHANLLH